MKYDVVVVGAGTAGIYFSLRLSKLGYKVLVIEKDKKEDVAKRLDIIHYPDYGYEDLGIPTPTKDFPEYSKEFLKTRQRSALNNHEKINSNHIYAVHLPLMNKRLANMAIEAGVSFEYQAKFDSFLYDDKKEISGICYRKNGEKINVHSLLVADATGIEAILRRQVNSKYMETFELTPMDKFYVILKCVIYDNKEDETLSSISWPYYKCWIGPFHKEKGGIIGTGSGHSFEYCQKMMDYYESILPRPKYSVDHFEYGSVPFKRYPYSFVSDHFIILGDSACLTNPMTGEGLYYHFKFVDMTIDVIDKALKVNKTDIYYLWKVNKIFNSNFVHETSYIRALVSVLMSMSQKENDYLFKKGIIFKDENEPYPNVFLALLQGVLTFKIRLSTFLRFIKKAIIASNIKKHYEKFPLYPEDYEKWKAKAERLWKKAGRITDYDKEI